MQCARCGSSNGIEKLRCYNCDALVGLGTATGPLSQALRHTEFDVVVSAAQALGNYPDPGIRSGAIAFLTDGLTTLKHPSAVAIALGKLDDPDAKRRAALFAAAKLSSGDHSKPWERVLLSTGNWPDDVMQHLSAALKISDNGVDQYAAMVLAKCPAPEAVAALLAFENSDDDYWRYWANYSLCAHGDAAQRERGVNHFIAQLSDEYCSDRMGAGEALGTCPDSSTKGIALNALVEEMTSEYGDVQAAIEAISKVDDTRAGAILSDVLTQIEFGSNLYAHVMSCIGSLSPTAKAQLVRCLSSEADNMNPNGIANAINAWGLCGHRDEIPRLRMLLDLGIQGLDAEARDALARLGEIDCVHSVCREMLSADGSMIGDDAYYASISRAEMCRVAGDICVPEAAIIAVPALSQALSDEPVVAQYAAKALGTIARRVRTFSD